jgi:hypothetical protein
MGVLQGEFTLARQSDKAMAALDNRRAKVFFQQANRGRKGWLRYMTNFRGAPEVLLARQGYKIFQLSQDHARNLAGGDPQR